MKSLLVVLGVQCNLNCTYCFQKRYREHSEISDGKEADRVISVLKKNSDCKFVSIIGGEIACYASQVKKIIAWISHNRKCVVHISTNGLVYFDWLLPYKEFVDLQVSVDFSYYANWKRTKDKQKYNKIISNIRRYAEEGFHMSVRSTLGMFNLIPALIGVENFKRSLNGVHFRCTYEFHTSILSALFMKLFAKKLHLRTCHDGMCDPCSCGHNSVCLDARTGKFYNCENCFDESYCIDGKDSLTYRTYYDTSLYRIHYLPKKLSDWILENHPFPICRYVNKLHTGNPYIISWYNMIEFW